jgi:hypothetical protein
MARLPNSKEWIKLQGGTPILLESPSHKVIEIIQAHANDRGVHDGTRVVLSTPSKQVMGSRLVHFALDNQELVVPAVLLWKFHGQPWEEHSEESYPRLEPNEVEDYIQAKQADGWKRHDI